MTQELVVAGGGIAGLAAALGARQAGWESRVLEQADGFSELGAGIQLGPNAVHILRDWGLLTAGALREHVFLPQFLRVRDGVDASELASLALGGMQARYGAPYLTVHRGDLLAALLEQARASGVRLHTRRRVSHLAELQDTVRVKAAGGPDVEAEAVVIADGLWSEARTAVRKASAAPAST